MSRKRFVIGVLAGLAATVSVAVAVRLTMASRPSDSPDAVDAPEGDNVGATERPRVVIVGGGFGGLTAARGLKDAPVDVLLIDKTNHHLFQPLLYQVAMAQLAPTEITAPLRKLMRHQANARVLMDEAVRVDAGERSVKLSSGGETPYDFLVLATGARHSYFGHDDWEPFAPGLKTIDDALDIRRRFLTAFERAEAAEDEAERRAYLTFVIVGGGPTGVELAGMLGEIARITLWQDFRRVDTRQTRIVLVEAGPRILPAFPDGLAARARRDLEGFGVEVRTGTTVTDVSSHGVQIGDDHIPSRTVFWAAGNAASPLAQSLAQSLDVPLDRAGRVLVEPDLSVPGHPEVFVVGDLALVLQDGKPVPGVAPAANQMGHTAADNIVRTLDGRDRLPFRYFNKGNLATIGRQSAIADLGAIKLSGVIGWFFWLFIHILYLVGFRNRLSVLFDWAYAYVTNQRGARLITHAE